jgi:sulfite reductase beta subunit-like hemoprotein
MKLTANQVRILVQIADGFPPTGFSPKGIESLVKRGLVTTTIGSYSRRVTWPPHAQYEIYCLTEAGVEALREEIERRYQSALRTAKAERDKDLRHLKGVKTA